MAKKKTNTKTPESKLRPLEDRQAAFCKEYIIDFNATQAAIRAGYTERSARQTASRLLSNDNVQVEIRRLMNERSKRTEITADAVLKQFAKTAFLDIRQLVEWGSEERRVDWEIDKDGNKKAIMEHFNYVRLKPMDDPDFDGTLIQTIKLDKHGEFVVEFVDRMKALEALAKHTGVYDDRPMVTVDVGSYVDALHGRVEAGDLWETFDNGGPDPKDDNDGES